MFWLDFWVRFLDYVLELFSRVSEQVFRAFIFKSKEVFQEWISWFYQKLYWVFHRQIYPSFSHTSLSFSLPYLSYRIFVSESYFCDQEKWSQVFHLLVLESVELRPRRTCEIVFCCSCENKWGTCKSKSSSVNSL